MTELAWTQRGPWLLTTVHDHQITDTRGVSTEWTARPLSERYVVEPLDPHGQPLPAGRASAATLAAALALTRHLAPDGRVEQCVPPSEHHTPPPGHLG